VYFHNHIPLGASCRSMNVTRESKVYLTTGVGILSLAPVTLPIR
jgi:hypothetical protein